MKVRFEPLGSVIEVGPGERVLDCLDEHLLEAPTEARPLPLQCRAGNCGTCLVEVELGEELLEPASARERRTLVELGAAPRERLGCQLVRGTDPAESDSGIVLRLRSRSETNC